MFSPMDPLDEFARRVTAARAGYALPLQATRLADEFATAALAVLFPHFAPARNSSPDQVQGELDRLGARLVPFLESQGTPAPEAREIRNGFIALLPGLEQELMLDAVATCEADPAARSVEEVVLAYPGFLAVACHRVAKALACKGVSLLPRLITEFAHRLTGIDIHPGARLGRSLAIDHGTGIVIGETAVIGDRVRLYQGVTLGALSVRKELARQKRHPTIEDDVVIYANATILGGETVIGAGSVIGGNVWLTHSVPPGSVVTHGATIERPRQSEEALLEFNI
jgi:serine O-acetyltransferase